MEQELQKQQPVAGQLATCKRLYLARWEQAFNEFMFLMAEQYSLELLIEVPGGKPVPSPMVQLWREELAVLSPNQIREGLKCYMRSERGRFKPTPGEIRDNAPGTTDDRPRKIKNPDCKDCRGTGYRLIEVDSISHPGKKAKRVTDCYCVRIEYGGETYTVAAKQLPAAPEPKAAELVSAEEAAATVNKVIGRLGNSMSWPQERTMSDAEYNRRHQELKRQAEMVEKKYTK